MYPKNHDFLIDIFKEVSQNCSSAILLLIGDGPLRQVIEKKVEMLGLKNQVKFLGLRNDVQDLYNVMDIFILPSHYEGLPVVGVEAQANGLPCLFSTKVTKEAPSYSFGTVLGFRKRCFQVGKRNYIYKM